MRFNARRILLLYAVTLALIDFFCADTFALPRSPLEFAGTTSDTIELNANSGLAIEGTIRHLLRRVKRVRVQVISRKKNGKVLYSRTIKYDPDSLYWRVDIPTKYFTPGKITTIFVQAEGKRKDPLGKALQRTIKIVPPSLPVVTIDNPAQGPVEMVAGGILLSGSASDNSRIESLVISVNGSTDSSLVTHDPTSGQWSYIIKPDAVTLGETVKLSVAAIDIAGNASEPVVRDVSIVDTTPATVQISSPQVGDVGLIQSGIVFEGYAHDLWGVTKFSAQVRDEARPGVVTNWEDRNNVLFDPKTGRWSYHVRQQDVTIGRKATLSIQAKDTAGNWSFAETVEILIRLKDLSSSEIARNLITLGYFTTSTYNTWVSKLPFEIAYESLGENRDRFIGALISLNILKPEYNEKNNLRAALLEKNVDIDTLGLRGDGILSAIDISVSPGSLFLPNLTTKALALRAVAAREHFRQSFNADRNAFLDFLAPKDFLKLLGDTSFNVAPAVKPLYMVTWSPITTHPLTDFIFNPAAVYATTSDDNAQLTSTTTVANTLNALPEGQRSILFNGNTYLFYSSTNPGVALPIPDRLLDREGRPVSSPDGKPLLFPSLATWKAKTRLRIDPWLQSLKTKIANVDNFILDYEDSHIIFYYIRDQFYREVSPGNKVWLGTQQLLDDPRMPEFLRQTGLTSADILNMKNWQWEGREQQAWDNYTSKLKHEAIDYAYFEPIRRAFPSAVSFNYETCITANTIRNGFKPTRDWETLGMSNFIPKTLPSNSIYGRYTNNRWGPNYEISPPAPVPYDKVTTSSYYTQFNSILMNFAQVDATAVATTMKHRSWVTNPSWADNMYGPQRSLSGGAPAITYDPDSLLFSGGSSLGDSMGEIYYRVAVETDLIPIWNGSGIYTTPTDITIVKSAMKEINEVMGFTDRKLIRDAWVEVNGAPFSVSPREQDPTADFLIWGVRANGKNYYRVVLKLPSSAGRESALQNAGGAGNPVQIRIGNSTIIIRNASLFHPTIETSKNGFWVVQDQDPNRLIQSNLSFIY